MLPRDLTPATAVLAATTEVLTAAWVIVAVLGLLAVCLHLLLRGRYDARVYVRPGADVRIVGRLSPAAVASLRQFFARDFAHRDRLTVLLRRRRDRTFELRFIPDVSPGERQQVRNFLAAHLSK